MLLLLNRGRVALTGLSFTNISFDDLFEIVTYKQSKKAIKQNKNKPSTHINFQRAHTQTLKHTEMFFHNENKRMPKIMLIQS